MAIISNILCLVIIVPVLINCTSVIDWCKIRCNNNAVHTMCQYRSEVPATECYGSNSVGLSAAEKNDILKKHNELRKKVASGKEKRGKPGPQPAAASMPDLTWDDELEKVAQRWASQCIFKRDSCRDVGRFPVGQNIAKSTAVERELKSLGDLVEEWYDQVQIFNKGYISSFKYEKPTRYYTQMLWAGTTKIGCGRIKFKHFEKKKMWDAVQLVCNYGPAGNVISSKMYEIKK